MTLPPPPDRQPTFGPYVSYFLLAGSNTPGTARLEHDKALEMIMLTLLKDDTQVCKQFVQNEAFKRAVSDMVYALTQFSPPPAA